MPGEELDGALMFWNGWSALSQGSLVGSLGLGAGFEDMRSTIAPKDECDCLEVKCFSLQGSLHESKVWNGIRRLISI